MRVSVDETDQIDLRLDWKQEEVTLTVQDHGKGFDRNVAAMGHGLQNIDSPSRLIHAEFTIESAPGEGTRATIIYRPKP